MLKLTGFTALAAFSAIGIATSASATPIVIAQYTFDNSDAANDIIDTASSALDAGTTDGTLSFGAGLAPTATDPVRTSASIDTTGTTFSSVGNRKTPPLSGFAMYVSTQLAPEESVADAIAAENYVGFTIAPTADLLQLDELSFNWRTNQSSDPHEFAVAVVDGVVIGSPVTLPADDDTNYKITMDLSGVAAKSGTYDIKFYIYGADGTSSSRHGRIDTIELTGENIIPEPASLVLLGLGGLCMLGRGRRSIDVGHKTRTNL